MYKLKGASDTWDISRSNNINYSDLDPGKYVLKIKARNYSGQVSDESEVTFTIKTPFWKSKLAMVIYIVIIILIIYINAN